MNRGIHAVSKRPLFFIGLHMPNHAPNFKRCMISVNRLKTRKSDIYPNEWLMDSGAFTEISTHGKYRTSVQEYADQINRWSKCGQFLGAVSQDYMCEPFILKKTGLTVKEHQRLTIERYDELLKYTDAYIIPVLQGFKTHEYIDHLSQYGDRIKLGMWVGVGSVCKRNSSPNIVCNILHAIKQQRPDLKLHGFGLKKISLRDDIIQSLLFSSDSMAWSFRGRNIGRGNDPEYAQEYSEAINNMPIQGNLFRGVTPMMF